VLSTKENIYVLEVVTCIKDHLKREGVMGDHRNWNQMPIGCLLNRSTEHCTATQWRTLVVMLINLYSREYSETLIISQLFS
jgi:hypothetical protein